jgi:high-affinity iron transporter
MFQAFMIVLREGVEAFLIVAISFAYLHKTGQKHLLSAIWWGIAASLFASGALGYLLFLNQGADAPLWEGIFGTVTVILVASLVVHMWRVGPELKKAMETKLSKAAAKSTLASYFGVFFFTVVMISREGMEMMLLLFQIRGDAQITTGIVLGVLGSAAIAVLWEQFGYRINFKRFFQITAVYFILFTIQIAIQAFHEFTEAEIFPNSEAWHVASEPFSTEGLYGKWYSNAVFAGCGLWLIVSLLSEKISKKPAPKRVSIPT